MNGRPRPASNDCAALCQRLMTLQVLTIFFICRWIDENPVTSITFSTTQVLTKNTRRISPGPHTPSNRPPYLSLCASSKEKDLRRSSRAISLVLAG